MFLRQIRNIVVLQRTAAAGIHHGAASNGSTSPTFASLNRPQPLRHHQCSMLGQAHQQRRLASSHTNKTPAISAEPLNVEPTAADTSDTASSSSADATAAGPTAALLAQWRDRLVAAEVPDPDSSLRNILAHVLRVKRLDTDTDAVVLTAAQLERFEELCECRLLRMPIQYIIGEWDFRDLTLQMRPPVFIPRPETEELVELVLQQIDVKRPLRFLEIGSGSGAISLALLRALPKAIGVALDQSEMACELTQSNAVRHQLDGRLTVRREKVTKQLALEASVDTEEMVDLIVSNPPYVPNGELRGLQSEVKIYEDLRALDGGVDGMDTIETILWLTAKRLRPATGALWLEVDPSHPALIEKYLAEHEDALRLKFVASYKDMFGKDRFVEIVRV